VLRGGVTPLARLGATVTGIDIADEAIKDYVTITQEGLQNRASCVVMDGEELGFPSNTFDVICCTGVLHHLNIRKAASSWAKVLKPDGRVAMIEPLAYHPLVMLYRFATPSLRTRDEHPLAPRDIRVLK